MANDTRDCEPLEVDCPSCFSRAGLPCTTPTSYGQRVVRYLHAARNDLASELNERTGMWPIEWLVVTGDTGDQVWFESYEDAQVHAQATLGDLFEVQKIASYVEQED